MTQMISVPCSFPEPLVSLSPVFVRAVSLVSALPCLPSIPTRHLHYSGLGLEYLESIYRHHSTHKPTLLVVTTIRHISPSHPDSHNSHTISLIMPLVLLLSHAVVSLLLSGCWPGVMSPAGVSRLSSLSLATPALSALATGDNTLHSPAQAGHRQHLVTGPYHNIHISTTNSRLSLFSHS